MNKNMSLKSAAAKICLKCLACWNRELRNTKSQIISFNCFKPYDSLAKWNEDLNAMINSVGNQREVLTKAEQKLKNGRKCVF